MKRAAATTVLVLAVSVATAMTASLAAGQQPDARPPAPSLNVVELFTSQGCSACPPADELLARLTQRPDLIALSFNVDYWDYLGWKDTLARPAHTRRQYAYASARGDGKVYTPQAVINGVKHVIGSHADEIDAAIAATRPSVRNKDLSLQLSAGRADLVIKLDGTPPDGKSATVFVASVRPAVKVKIKRGENSGRRITYHNVVRTLVPVGMWSGGPKQIRLPRRDFVDKSGERCAVLVQAGGPGAILAAGWIPN